MNLDSILNILPGWKTKITVIVGAILVVLTQGFDVAIPEWIYQVLGLFGLYAVRQGITNDTAAAVEKIADAVAKKE